MLRYKNSKTVLNLFILTFLFCFLGQINNSEAKGKAKRLPDFRNFYGICWNGKAHDNLVFAKQMGYDYVFYQRGMENDPLAKDLIFYIESPQYSVYPVPRTLDASKSFTDEEKSLYEKYFAKKNDQPFPNNMATGWFTRPTSFSVEPDFQQQEVIDTMVNRIIKYAKSLERKENNFLCGGFAWDVPQLPGDFWDAPQKKGGQSGGGHQITLSFWNGKDVAYQPAGVKFNYQTYSDGHAAFYKDLFRKCREAFPGSKFMIEPWMVWDSWFAQINDRADSQEITPDLVVQEKDGTEFVNDERIFKTGIITKEFVGSTTPNRVGEKQNREIAATAAMNGAWFSWFGRFGGTGDMPGYRNITEVPARLQLVRRVANWDNLNAVPLSSRSWDGFVYQSPLSRMDSTVIYSAHPDNGKIFAVWLSPDGKIDLPKKTKVISVFRTDSLFVETANGKDDIEIFGHRVKLINNNGLGKGYILRIKK